MVFGVGEFNIVPKKELHRRVWVNPKPKTLSTIPVTKPEVIPERDAECYCGEYRALLQPKSRVHDKPRKVSVKTLLLSLLFLKVFVCITPQVPTTNFITCEVPPSAVQAGFGVHRLSSFRGVRCQACFLHFCQV